MPATSIGLKADKPRSYLEIENIAEAVRARLVPEAVTDCSLPCFPIFDRLPDSPGRVMADGRSIRLTNRVAEIPVYGHTRFDSSSGVMEVCLSVATYRGLEKEEPRDRFTFSHELGHLVLHTEQVVRLAELPHNTAAMYRMSGAHHRPFEDCEWQANAFAGAFLMPARLIRGSDFGDLAQVQRTFGVSYTAAETRLSVLKRFFP